MAENNRYQFLALDTPEWLQGDVVNGPPTLHEFERGRKLWIYDQTPQIIEYTNDILKMDEGINDAIGKFGLAVAAIQKGPRVVRTGNGPGDYQEARPDSIAIITPIVDEKVPVFLAEIGKRFSKTSFISAGKRDKVIILPGTKFCLRAPYYLMARPVRNV